MEQFARILGFAFQIADDILDETAEFQEIGKTPGKDKSAKKLTYTALYGIEEAKCKVSCLLEEASDILKRNGFHSQIFEMIISGIQERTQS